MAVLLQNTGLQVNDLREDAEFASRALHTRDIEAQMEGLQRLSRALVDHPDTVLQELVHAAVDLCGADSAGISIERENGSDEDFYHWVATAGDYSGFLNAALPRYPSACGICLERGHPQHFTVSDTFFDILQVEAPVVTDGILLPWKTEDTRGTIFVMAHTRSHAFDAGDVRLMHMLADFAAMGYRQQKQRARSLAQERLEAAAQIAHQLAHEINNPLQSITNTAFLLSSGDGKDNAAAWGALLADDIQRLSNLVKELLAVPFAARTP